MAVAPNSRRNRGGGTTAGTARVGREAAVCESVNAKATAPAATMRGGAVDDRSAAALAALIAVVTSVVKN